LLPVATDMYPVAAVGIAFHQPIDPFFIQAGIAHIAAGGQVGGLDPFFVVRAVASKMAAGRGIALEEQAIRAKVFLIEEGSFFEGS